MSNFALEKCEKIIMRYCLNNIILGQGFCPLKIKIVYFRHGFCRNPLYVEMRTMFVGDKDTASS